MEVKLTYFRGPLFRWVALSLVTYALAHFFVGWFMSQEDTIYQWDLVIYWKKWQAYLYYIPREPLRVLRSFVFQLRHDIYTDIPAVLCTPLGWVLGPSRTSFIHSVSAMYAVPAVLCGVFALRNYTKEREESPGVLIGVVAWLHLFLFIPMWRPVVRGNVGAGAVLIAFVILLLWFRRPLAKQKVGTLLLVALLLVLLPLFRRWMAYWVVSFFVACGATQVFPLFWKEGLGAFIRVGAKVALVGVVALGVFVVVVFPGLHSVWLVDYQEVYADYSLTRSFRNTALMAKWHIGPYFLLMSLWGVVHGLRRNSTRLWTSFLSVHLTVSAILFLRTQDFAEHHYYLLLPCLSLLAAQGSMDVLWRIPHRVGRFFVAVLLGGFLLFQFVFSFSPEAGRFSQPLRPLLASWNIFPLHRADLGEIEELLGTLAEEVKKRPDAAIYTLASSRVISDNLLREAHLVLDLPMDIRPNLLSLGHRDRANFFPHDLITCDYAVVCDPAQVHLNPDDQKIVVLPTEHFLEGRGIAVSFEQIGRSFELSNGVRAMIYKRTSVVGADAISVLEEELGAPYQPPAIEGVHPEN